MSCFFFFAGRVLLCGPVEMFVASEIAPFHEHVFTWDVLFYPFSFLAYGVMFN